MGQRTLIRHVVVAVSCLWVMMAPAAGPAQSQILLPTAQGPVQVAASPRRVAVFDLAALDMLLALGVSPAGVPNKLYLPELQPLAEQAVRVGTLFEPDLEALSALNPDLVILGGRSSPRLAAVQQLAPAIDMSISGTDLIGEARQRLLAYGLLFERTARAEALARDLDAAVAATRSAAHDKGRALIVMANGPKISIFGPSSRFGWLHRDLALPAALETAASAIHGDVASFELLRKIDPDWLLVLDRGASIGEGSGRATLENDLVAQTRAGQRGQIVYLPPGDFYLAPGGVTTTLRILTVLRTAFASAR